MATILNCENYGNLTTDCNGAQIGGIIGQLNGQTIKGCVNYGNITATANGATVVGRIAGNSLGSSSIVASDAPCVNYGIITLNLSETAPTTACGAGGISGEVSAASVPFTNCSNAGAIARWTQSLVRHHRRVPRP